MIGAIIITHGDLAKALLEAAESITGRIEGMKTLSVKVADTTESIRAGLASQIKELGAGGGVIIFTDMFGGTPTNIALSFLDPGKVEVITGVNLPLLIKFTGHRSEKRLGELAVYLKEYGQGSIVLAADMLKDKK